jgi:hypothetical protein
VVDTFCSRHTQRAAASTDLRVADAQPAVFGGAAWNWLEDNHNAAAKQT